jgi:hypothetical protein
MVAALGSCLSVRSRQGRWLLRIEDVDAPRSVPGAADGILRTLEAFGFAWDGEVVWQTRRTAAYQRGFRPPEGGRAALRVRMHAQGDGRFRPGPGWHRRYPAPAVRGCRPVVRPVPGVCGCPGWDPFLDGIQGLIEEDVSADVGDFVLLRADGLFAYQLAVVVDDAEAGVTEWCGGRICSTRRRARSWCSTCSPTHAVLRPSPCGDQRCRREAVQADAGPQYRESGAASRVRGCPCLSWAGAPAGVGGWRPQRCLAMGLGGIGHCSGFRRRALHRVPLTPEWHSKPFRHASRAAGRSSMDSKTVMPGSLPGGAMQGCAARP